MHFFQSCKKGIAHVPLTIKVTIRMRDFKSKYMYERMDVSV